MNGHVEAPALPRPSSSAYQLEGSERSDPAAGLHHLPESLVEKNARKNLCRASSLESTLPFLGVPQHQTRGLALKERTVLGLCTTTSAGHSGQHEFTLPKQTLTMTDTNQFLPALNLTISYLPLEKQSAPSGHGKRTSI